MMKTDFHPFSHSASELFPTPNETGVYEISNHGSDSFPVYCDQTSDRGGTSN